MDRSDIQSRQWVNQDRPHFEYHPKGKPMDSMNLLIAAGGLFIGALTIAIPVGIKIGKIMQSQQGHETRLGNHSEELTKLWERLDNSLDRIASAELKNAEVNATMQGRMNTLESQCSVHRATSG